MGGPRCWLQVLDSGSQEAYGTTMPIQSLEVSNYFLETRIDNLDKDRQLQKTKITHVSM